MNGSEWAILFFVEMVRIFIGSPRETSSATASILISLAA